MRRSASRSFACRTMPALPPRAFDTPRCPSRWPTASNSAYERACAPVMNDTRNVLTAGSAPVDLAPGALIDGWRVGELVHEGGTARIYRVYPEAVPDPGFPVLIKAPPLGRGQPALGLISFEMEQMILPNLAGPHVPRFVATGDTRATPYLVMEWIEGDSLAQLASTYPLPIDDVTRLGARIADAVHGVHEQHVIHFDLKPENVLLRSNGRAVLIDFGFARHDHYPDLL